MSQNAPTNEDDAMTLDPPGRIAVIGAGPAGLECALYGRFLGYEVIVVEAEQLGGSLNAIADQPLPMMPDRCLSPLALGAIDAQRGDGEPRSLPLTVEQWIQEGLIPVAHSDLLTGRVRLSVRCESIHQVPIEPSDEDESEVEDTDGDELDGDIPPDFELWLRQPDGTIEREICECVILATGRGQSIELNFETPAPYFFRIGEAYTGDVETDLISALREIVSIYASLGGRPDLDLYRPRRI